MSEKSNSKYASEAFELFRLFNQVGKSFFGLLLLEIRWLFVLWLTTKLIPDNADSFRLPIPYFKSLSPFNIYFEETDITKIAVVGGLLVFIIWIIYSRLSQIIVRPIRLITYLTFRWLVIVISFFLFLIEMLLITLCFPLIRFILLRRIIVKRRWFKKYKQKHSGIDAKDINVKYLEIFKRFKKNKKIDLLVPTLEKTIEKGTIISGAFSKVFFPTLFGIQSNCLIGISHFVSY